MHALAIGAAAEPAAASLGEHGAAVVHVADHDLLGDYGPEAWGDVARRRRSSHSHPTLVIASGTDVGNEVLAHAAAILDLPFVGQLRRASASGSTTVGR